MIAEFRRVYNIGICSGAWDAAVTVGEWVRCVGGDARLFTNTNPKPMSWYQAKAYAALRGAKLPVDYTANRLAFRTFQVIDDSRAASRK